MATSNYCCFKGRGRIALADYAALAAKTAGLMEVGNASQFEITVSEKTEEIPDYASPTGGTACRVSEIEKIEFALTLMCHSPANFARAAYGTGTEGNVAKAAIASQGLVLWPGAVLPLDGLIDDAVPVVVSSVGANPTAYVAGRDYEVLPGGSLRALPGGTIPAPTVTAGVGQGNITVTYGTRDQTLIQLYSRISLPMALHFDGVNIAEGGAAPVQFQLYKIQLSAAKSMAMINDSVSKLEFSGTALRDSTRPMGTAAVPLSQYGTLRI